MMSQEMGRGTNAMIGREGSGGIGLESIIVIPIECNVSFLGE